jgi:hypothetical protein
MMVRKALPSWASERRTSSASFNRPSSLEIVRACFMTHLLITPWMVADEKGSRTEIFPPARIAANSRYMVDWF